ncbi:MAG: hypothetical protein EXS16_07725 [Gemmataceae bacterium]|nr:hypothetical protein [Gemmataceae bacterium]
MYVAKGESWKKKRRAVVEKNSSPVVRYSETLGSQRFGVPHQWAFIKFHNSGALLNFLVILFRDSHSEFAARFNTDTTLNASVTPDGPNTFDFEVKSR